MIENKQAIERELILINKIIREVTLPDGDTRNKPHPFNYENLEDVIQTWLAFNGYDKDYKVAWMFPGIPAIVAKEWFD